jgi:DNA-damage-inducible protein J
MTDEKFYLCGIVFLIHQIMATSELVQARMEPALKQKAENYFHSFGIDTATAIRMYFSKVVETGTIPFEIGVSREDWEDAQVAEQAYQEYVDGGKQSRPITELINELTL